ncbi:hypothetical protein C0431_08310 [bacterium]|nr:hypothetical protein [bacterium]
METIHPDWKEFLRLLVEKNVEFLLVGGHAVAIHGYPRFTSDLDCFFGTAQENCEKLNQVLIEFGFGAIEIGKLKSKPQVFMLGREPFRIDLLNDIDGVEFDQAFFNSIFADFGGIQLRVISRDDLMRNKRASGRKKDLADLEELS